MTVDHVDFPKLTDLYFKYKTAVGLMNGRYEWTGIGSDARTMNGKGEVEVRNGDVFAIPLFGPLSDILNKIMPGVGYRVARKGNMSFTIKDGVIRTSDFHVIFSMTKSTSTFALTPAEPEPFSLRSINFSNIRPKAV